MRSPGEVQMGCFSFECRVCEAVRCSIGGKGRGGLCQWFRWGTVDDKVGEGDGRDLIFSLVSFQTK